ncbi:hypothetical protein DA70_09555 [Pandoraea pnomenusa]|uniref:tail fiber domain-containing protein n=1 Tax=Pandoraea pnomenusa TaxID=93220 RepID=UPI0004376496|nr:tail fiber domain-containing protein [Pandoraea pnomenusa]AHN77411.1 hypothetical protein DA70_09555 [Pandoraea pnomenusa]
MTKQTINLGTPPEGKDGDTARSGFTKVNMNFDELYARAQGKLPKGVGGPAGTIALTAAEALCGVIDLTGQLTGARVVTVPADPPQMYVVRNSTTGAFSLTFQTDTGTGAVIKAGASSILYCDGKDIVDPYGAAIGALQTGLSNANTSIAATNANLDTTNTNVAAKMPLAGGTFTGVVRYGTTSSTPGIGAATYGAAIDSATGYIAVSRSNASYSLYVNNAAGPLVYFGNTASQLGSITTNGSSTAYNTTSDYRLKENVVPISGALDRLSEMHPVRFNFIADAKKQVVDGFIAHELAEVVPEAVFGTKDAVQYEPVYREGYDPQNIGPEDVIGTREVIVPQAVDYSKVTPLLAAAILELWSVVKSGQTA